MGEVVGSFDTVTGPTAVLQIFLISLKDCWFKNFLGTVFENP